jgi:hypothetical protein
MCREVNVIASPARAVHRALLWQVPVVAVLLAACGSSEAGVRIRGADAITTESTDVPPPFSTDVSIPLSTEVPPVETVPGDGGNGGSNVDCTLPRHENTAGAYRYGLPEGWLADTAGETLTISPDETTTTAAMVYTARLMHDRSAEWFLGQFGEIMNASFAQSGGSFALDGQTGSGSAAVATISAAIGDQPISGEMAAGVDGGFVTLRAMWAPASDFYDRRSLLDQILGCYERITALDDKQLAVASEAATQPDPGASSNGSPWGALETRSAGTFSFTAPQSWNANPSSGGTGSSIELTAPSSDAAVGFVYDLGRYGATTQQLIDAVFNAYGIQASLGGQTTAENGATLFDMSGTIGGGSMRGMIGVLTVPYQTFFANYIILGLSAPERWDEYQPTLTAIANSIVLTDASGPLSQLPAMPDLSVEAVFGDTVTSSREYRTAVEDRVSEEWAEAMRGYETVESPTTGERWDVPLNAWDPAGPYGAGYYRSLPGGGVELLVSG